MERKDLLELKEGAADTRKQQMFEVKGKQRNYETGTQQ